MPGKKFVQLLRQRKKFVQANSKVQIVLKFVQRLNAFKKILHRHETEKKIRAAKILYPPPLPGFLMVRPLVGAAKDFT